MSALIASIGGFVAAGVGMLQADAQYKEALDQENAQHAVNMKLMQEQFNAELEAEKKSYLVATYNDMERYFQELNENLINCTLDAERDMIDQRNQQFQTLLIASAMMFTALLSILYQGGLPLDSKSYIVISYAVFIAVSLVLLLVAITFCTLIVKDVTRFMLKRSKQNMSHLSEAIRNTKHMTQRLKDMKMGNVGEGGSRTAQVVDLTDEGVDMLWRNHEVEVQELLRRRMEIVTVKENNLLVAASFEDHWREHCKALADVSLYCFYLGTACMLVATLIFTGAQFSLQYKSMRAAWASISTLGASIIISFLLSIYMRKLDPHIRGLNEELAREEGERRAFAQQRVTRWRSWFHRTFRWVDTDGSDKTN